MPGRRLVPLAALLAALALAGLAAAATTAPRTVTAPGGTLAVNLSGATLGPLDPALAYSRQAWALTYLVNLTLNGYPDAAGAAGLALAPDGAELPGVSADGLVYTFAIRPGGRFSTGEAVTAKSFADAIDRTLDPRLKSPGAQRSFLGAVVGFDDKVAGRTAHLAGVTASGLLLTVRLGRPDPALPQKLSLPFFAAVPKGLPVDPAGVAAPVSAGPYAIKAVTARTVTLARNPYYTGARPRNPEAIVVTVGTSQAKSLAAVKAGTADLDLGGVPAEQVAALAPLLGRQLFVDRLRLGLDYLVLNTAPGRLLADVAARKALNYAVDRAAMLRARGAFPGVATDQILPPGMPGFRDERLYPLAGADPERALAAYAKGGALTLYAAGDPAGDPPIQALVLQANLARIGITVTIQQFPPAELQARIATKGEPFDAALVAWSADYPDPSALLGPLFAGSAIAATGSTNTSYLKVPAVDRALDAAAALAGQARATAYADLDRLLMTRYAPVVPLLVRSERTFVSARLDPRCYVFQPVFATIDLGAACLR